MVSSSSSSYSDSDEDMGEILRTVGLNKKYGKVFAKAHIEDLDDARDLTDRRLKKIGIESASDRKKILKAIAEAAESDSSTDSSSSSSSDSESDSSSDSEIESRSKSKSKSKSSSKAKSGSKKEKPGNLKVSRTTKGSKDSGSSSSSSSKNKKSKGKIKTIDEKKIIDDILRKEGLASLAPKLFEHDVDTLEKARALSPTRLKQMGIDTLSARFTVLNAFRDYGEPNSNPNSPGAGGNSQSENEGEQIESSLLKALKRVKQEKHFENFCKRKLDKMSIRELQNLGNNELQDIGIENPGQRAMIIEALREADWKCVYCGTWNEHRKTCCVCSKTHRITNKSNNIELVGGHASDTEGENVNENEKIELEEQVKYIGRFRPTTRLKYGDKGTVYRVLEEGFFMVKFLSREGKNVTIRLQANEIAKIKQKSKGKGKKMLLLKR